MTNNAAIDAALRAAPLDVPIIPESEWPATHAKWDRIEAVARWHYRKEHPSAGEIIGLLGMVEICEAIIASRHDGAMLKRLTPMIGKRTTHEALTFAAVLLRSLQAENLPEHPLTEVPHG